LRAVRAGRTRTRRGFCLACETPFAAATGPGEERRIVSVLFVELVGFTTAAEQLDPEGVRAILNPYYDGVRGEIERFGGGSRSSSATP
jgi:class 3 adenylate cyclase